MENTGGNNMNQLNQFMKRYPKIALYSMITIAAAVVIIVIAAHSSVAVNASPDHENQKYFTTVQVNSGDTLWDLSQEYITSEYASVDDYIKEVEKINHISKDEITAGCYLVVPYYAEKPVSE